MIRFLSRVPGGSPGAVLAVDLGASAAVIAAGFRNRTIFARLPAIWPWRQSPLATSIHIAGRYFALVSAGRLHRCAARLPVPKIPVSFQHRLDGRGSIPGSGGRRARRSIWQCKPLAGTSREALHLRAPPVYQISSPFSRAAMLSWILPPHPTRCWYFWTPFNPSESPASSSTVTICCLLWGRLRSTTACCLFRFWKAARLRVSGPSSA